MTDNSLILSPDQPLTLPSYLQGANLGVSAGLLATIGQGGNRIGLKGNRFRQIINGKEEGVWDENYLDVIILGAVPHISRVFYEGAYDQTGETKAAPTCYSADGIAPPDDVKQKQSLKCDVCPQNQKGSKIVNGNKIKACGFFQRLIVMLAGDLEGITYRLDVKSMGIFGDSHPQVNKYNIRDFTKFITNRGVDVSAVVTRLSFDTDSSVPKLLFQPNRFITADEYAVVSEKVASEEVKQMLTINMTTVDLSGEVADPAPTHQEAHPATPAQQATAAAPKPTAPAPAVTGPLTMTDKADGGTYDEFVAAGWTDQQMIDEGYALPRAKPTPPAPKPAPPAPKPTPAPAAQKPAPAQAAPQRAARAPTSAPRAAAPAKPPQAAPTKPATPAPQKPAGAPTVNKGIPVPREPEQVQETQTDEDVQAILDSLEV